MKTKIIIKGANGKMGKVLSACAKGRPEEFEVVANMLRESSLSDNLISEADVVVDFSVHEATAHIVSICAENHKAMVIGTTGHTEIETDLIKGDSWKIPIVMASNFSTGVNMLFYLTRKAAEILGPDFDLEIVEMHHRFKKDAPSGTAKSLANILKCIRQEQLHESEVDPVPHIDFKNGRSGYVGERQITEIGIHSVRGGDVVGDHTVIFAGNGERVELTHKASSRETFANGALRAAQWVIGKPPGLYDMMDVLGLK